MIITDLQQELNKYVQQAEQERLVAVEQHAREQAEAKAAKQAELDYQAAQIKSNEARHAKIKRDAEFAELIAQRDEHASRIRLEQAHNSREEGLRLQRAEIERMEKLVEQTKWTEEQHRKSLLNVIPPDLTLKGRRVLPQVKDTSGNATVGTEGLELGPEMSEHMRIILRQENRT